MSGRLAGRLIGLGVTGSIAAYKAVELLRLLTAEGADVVVLLSPSATQFIGPLSFAALSRHPVESDVLDLLPDGRIGHIVVADSADAIVVAPATAHWLGAMANGMASDTVTAAALATSAPVVVAPAMDGDMWSHPATVANVARLREAFGYVVVAPDSGPLASGQSGQGRLAELPGSSRRSSRRWRARRSANHRRRPGRRWSRDHRVTPTSSGDGSSSRPVARESRSTPCASSAIDPPDGWASRWLTPRSPAARA